LAYLIICEEVLTLARKAVELYLQVIFETFLDKFLNAPNAYIVLQTALAIKYLHVGFIEAADPALK
jgi:hypothetical protein